MYFENMGISINNECFVPLKIVRVVWRKTFPAEPYQWKGSTAGKDKK